jgi:hypothetical protein
MRRFALLLSLPLLASAAGAQPVEAPRFAAGDKWTMRYKEEQLGKPTMLERVDVSVVRADSRNLVISQQPLDSGQGKREQFLNPDWSRPISIAGTQVVIRKPFDFPLQADKTWQLKWEDATLPPPVKLERNEVNYRVVGWEDVTVPAGTFHAMKIEADGSWYREYRQQGPAVSGNASQNDAVSVAQAVVRKPFTPPPASGRRYQAWWFVPEVKRDVKSIIEMSGAQGELVSRETAEMEKFTPAGEGQR